MAKGIRSKAKRQNRSLIRATLSEPIAKKRQEEINASLKKSLNEQNGSTIKGLKSLFPGGSLGQKPAITAEPVAMETEGAETKVSTKKDNNKPKVVKGSRPRSNPNKPLTWF